MVNVVISCIISLSLPSLYRDSRLGIFVLAELSLILAGGHHHLLLSNLHGLNDSRPHLPWDLLLRSRHFLPLLVAVIVDKVGLRNEIGVVPLAL
jgi:hypothetical protein